MTDRANVIVDLVGELDWCYLATPQEKTYDDGTKKSVYGTTIIIDPAHKCVADLKAAQREVVRAHWGANAERVLAEFAEIRKIPLKSGDKKLDKEGAPVPAYTGKVYVVASIPNKRPRIIVTEGGKNVEIEPGHRYFPYSGCKALVKAEIYALGVPGQRSKNNVRGVFAKLMGVQFLGDGTPRAGGGRIASVDEFGINPLDGDAPIPGGSGAADGLF